MRRKAFRGVHQYLIVHHGPVTTLMMPSEQLRAIQLPREPGKPGSAARLMKFQQAVEAYNQRVQFYSPAPLTWIDHRPTPLQNPQGYQVRVVGIQPLEPPTVSRR